MGKGWRRRLAAGFLGAAVATTAAAQGRVEINHVSALAGGVTPGDAPGYPVTLSQSGSYVLTGPLEVTSLNVSAIIVAADDIAIDLQGFAIRGPNTCTISSCGSGNGNGIGMNSSSANRRRVRVRDGQIIGVGGAGIALGDEAEVRGMLVSACGGDGIQVGDRSLVVGNRSIGNLDYGVVLGDHAGFGDNVLAGNDLSDGGGGPSKGGEPLGGNVCGTGGCWGRGARRYYLTPTTQNGAAADAACSAGFHMASWYEVRFAGGLEYDATRGQTTADSGSGPPTSGSTTLQWGWIRTGSPAEVDSHAVGRANCAAWTSAATGDHGAAVGLYFDWAPDSGGTTVISGPVPDTGWTFANVGCASARPTWCIED